MDDVMEKVGQRIVQTARLAVLTHLHQAMLEPDLPRQRVTIGGADSRLFTEEGLPAATYRPRRSSLFADEGAE